MNGTQAATHLGPATLPGTESWLLRAHHIDQDYVINVALPSVPMRAGRLFPVVYVLDGDSSFGIASQAARMLLHGHAGIPPVIVVGIGYRHDANRPFREQQYTARTRDYTPSADHNWLDMNREVLEAQGCSVGSNAQVSGGAAAFLAFLRDEVQPFIAARYPADPADQSLTGTSLGGLFTLYALFEAPGAFQRYGASSPSIWWDDRVILRHEEAAASRPHEGDARLFLSVGELEEEDGPPYHPLTNFAELVERLESRHASGLQLAPHVFPGETHNSVYPAAISRGLREMFAR